MVEDKYANATFHPKFFEFQFADKVIVMVGSANLTGAGMSRNGEMGAEIECGLESEQAKQGEAAWRAMHDMARTVTLPLIRSSRDSGGLGSERGWSETRSNKAGKPRQSPRGES